MKISKLHSAIVLLLFGASLVSAPAQDNPKQAAARAALEKIFQSPTNAARKRGRHQSNSCRVRHGRRQIEQQEHGIETHHQPAAANFRGQAVPA